MIRALSQLLRSWADRLSPIPPVVPPAAGEWSETDAMLWKTFLGSPTGKKLSQRLRYLVAEIAINGARNTTNTVHACGVSAGWDEAVRYLHSISRVSRVEDTNQAKTPPGEMELLEQLSP